MSEVRRGASEEASPAAASLVKFGPYVLQGVLDALDSEAQLKSVMQLLDWPACSQVSREGPPWAFQEVAQADLRRRPTVLHTL